VLAAGEPVVFQRYRIAALTLPQQGMDIMRNVKLRSPSVDKMPDFKTISVGNTILQLQMTPIISHVTEARAEL
jgi:hypothetical protein